MTASILNEDPSTQNVQKKAVYKDKLKHANFRGTPLYQATKRQLNNS